MSRRLRLRRRPRRTLPAALVAALLVVLGTLTVLAAVLRLIDGAWPGPAERTLSAVRSLTWGSGLVLTVAVIAVLLGGWLVVLACSPGRFRHYRLRTAGANTEAVLPHTSLARLAVAHARSVDGVQRVVAIAAGRTVRVRVDTPESSTGALRTAVTDRVRRALSASGLDPVPRVVVVVRLRNTGGQP